MVQDKCEVYDVAHHTANILVAGRRDKIESIGQEVRAYVPQYRSFTHDPTDIGTPVPGVLFDLELREENTDSLNI
jgi:hypothetical protein